MAELAEAVPAFAVARGGTVPVLGTLLGSSASADGAARAVAFTDSWYVPRGAARSR